MRLCESECVLRYKYVEYTDPHLQAHYDKLGVIAISKVTKCWSVISLHKFCQTTKHDSIHLLNPSSRVFNVACIVKAFEIVEKIYR